MIKGKETKRTLEDIGKRCYDFDFELEKSIYSYVCCIRTKRKAMKKLDKNLKFESYHQWKQYIRIKYGDFSKDCLEEFARYLNQRVRNVKFGLEYNNLAASIILTIVLAKLGGIIMDDMVIDIVDSFVEGKLFAGLALMLIPIIILIVILYMVYLLFYHTTKPIFCGRMEDSLLKDYKEIIDEIAREKEKQ